MKRVIFLLMILVLLTGCITYVAQEVPAESVVDEELVIEPEPEAQESVIDEVAEVAEEDETVTGPLLPENQYRVSDGDQLIINNHLLVVEEILDNSAYLDAGGERAKITSTNYPEILGDFQITIKSFDYVQTSIYGQNSMVIEILPFELGDNQYKLIRGDFMVLENTKVKLDDVKSSYNTEYAYISILGTNVDDYRIKNGKLETFRSLNITGSGIDVVTIRPLLLSSKIRNYGVFEIILNPE
ncbi:MAG: hypothetical protein ABIF40_01920 [archaeon]